MRIRINEKLIFDDVVSVEFVNVQNGMMIEDFKDPTDGFRVQTYSPPADNCFYDEHHCATDCCYNPIPEKAQYCPECLVDRAES